MVAIIPNTGENILIGLLNLFLAIAIIYFIIWLLVKFFPITVTTKNA